MKKRNIVVCWGFIFVVVEGKIKKGENNKIKNKKIAEREFWCLFVEERDFFFWELKKHNKVQKL